MSSADTPGRILLLHEVVVDVVTTPPVSPEKLPKKSPGAEHWTFAVVESHGPVPAGYEVVNLVYLRRKAHVTQEQADAGLAAFVIHHCSCGK